MSSKFAPPKVRSKVPGYCKIPPGCFPPAYVDGIPTSLSAYAFWREPNEGWQATDSLRLNQTVPGTIWEGHNAGPGQTLAVTVQKVNPDNVYRFAITILIDNVPLETYVFMDRVIQQPPPFDSLLLDQFFPLSNEHIQLHVMD